MKVIIIAILFAAVLAVQQAPADIIPVTSWPSIVRYGGMTYYQPSVSICVSAGYRMLAPKPATPAGQRIVSEKIIQDPSDPSKCVFDLTYEDIPAPPVPVVVGVTNIIVGRIQFVFTTNGSWKGVTWLDARPR